MTARITRKQLKGDEFVSTIDTLIHWLMDNWRPVVAVLGAVVVVTMIWWAASLWTGGRADRASYLLQQAVASYEEAAGKGGDADTKPAETKLQEVVDRYGRTDQADVARLYLARIELSRGQVDAARDALVRLSQKRGDDLIGRLATFDLISLRIASGQGAEVAGELEAMVQGRSQGLPRDAALYQLGMLYLKEHKPDQAREMLTKLSQEFPESPYAQSAQQRLRELG